MNTEEETSKSVECPRCGAHLEIDPGQPVQDLVLAWSDTPLVDERPMVAGISPDGTLILGLTNQHGKKIPICISLGVPMPQMRGPDAPFQLLLIHPGVLKLRPSVFAPEIHAYITITGAPFALGKKDKSLRNRSKRERKKRKQP